jgi:protein-arginine kinase activator protein McsA
MEICQVCKLRQARLHITEVDKSTGAVQSLDICLHCAADRGLLPTTGPLDLPKLLTTSIQQVLAPTTPSGVPEQESLDDDTDVPTLAELESLVQGIADEDDEAEPGGDDETPAAGDSEVDDDEPGDDATPCPECGIDFDEIKSTGRFGCANDFVVFERQAAELIQRAQGANEHKGSAPGNLATMRSRRIDLRRLRAGLQAAVAVEDFELAARLRDQIRDLEQGTGDADGAGNSDPRG